MCSPAHSHYPSRPLSTITRPPASDEPRLTRKYSLDHGEWKLPPSTPSPPARHKDLPLPPMGDLAQVTNMQTEDRPPGGESACLPTDRVEEEDVNHNGPCVETRTRGRQQVLKKQASFESIGCDDNYFYDFFDRNCRPPTPSLPTSDVLRDTSLPPLDSEVSNDLNVENNNEPINTNRLEGNPGASSKLRRNVNSVRPRSWLTASTARVEDGKKARRRQTDPCGKDFLSNYEKALSSLLYQPYECRSEGPSATTSTYDDSDVGYWLGGASSKKYGERERRSAGECCSYQNESSDCTSSSASSSSSSLAGYIRRKPWGDCKDPSSSSIRALLTDWRTGNAGSASGSAEAGDLEASLPREPLVALPTGCRAAPCQSAPGDGREMVTTGDLIGSGSGSGSAPADPVDAEVVSVNSCYRAVPATVSAVPVIPCNNNVSNVRIVQTTRTFTSTEAQTDDVIVDAIRVPPGPSGVNPNREQRRRERRERRHQRRMVNHLHQTPDPAMWQAPLGEPMVDRLPDILNSHLPPPYTTLPLGLPPPQGHMHPPPPLPPTMPPPMAVPTVAGSPTAQPGGLRFPFAIVPAGRRRSRLSPHFTPEDEPKSCCGVAVSQTVSIRWFIVLIFLVGLCCAVVGTVLGAMKASGRDHLTVSLLMIGVGIVLVAVSAVAWRLTSQDAPSCRAMLGLGSDDSGGEPNRRFVPRLPPSYGRPHHPYAAMMYPEFQYRAPPPSYQASMQEYRLRLLLLDRHSGASPAAAVSPPPTYRSQAGSLLRAPIAFRGRDTLTPSQSEYSRPPSYRSRTSSRPDPPSSHSHSREPSGSDPGQAINVITVHPQHIIKLAPSPPLPAKNGKEHLVTIVQTAAEPSGPVIVTISGQHDMPSTTHCPESEMEILAHL